MSEAARILEFPHRWQPSRTPEETSEAARAFIEAGAQEESTEEINSCLSDPDVLSSICKSLRNTLNSNPRLVAAKASSIHKWLRAQDGRCGLFDEAAYFQGDTALLAAGALRIMGEREETETWLQRAEAGFRHTVNPGPLLAQTAYVRLALLYDRRRYQEVLSLLPSVLESFEKFGMRAESAKTRFLEAMALKDCSRRRESFERLVVLRDTLDEIQEAGLLGQVHADIGAYHASEGRNEEALRSYQKGLTLLSTANRLLGVANLKMTVGETLEFQGRLPAAVRAYREGIAAYTELGMATWAAYGRLILAEALVELGRRREAEWEILAALPTIEEQKMVPEGFAAVALLRESVRRRNTDSNALRELREHLRQANS